MEGGPLFRSSNPPFFHVLIGLPDPSLSRHLDSFEIALEEIFEIEENEYPVSELMTPWM